MRETWIVNGAVVTQLVNGRWVPAIPEPYPLLLRVRCACGAKLWSRDKYRAHYAIVHQGRPADALR